jgi:hypothetical protein
MGGISQLYNPFHRDPYWGNPVGNNQHAFNSVAHKPVDSAAEIGQRFIAPAVVYGVSQAVLGGFGRNVGIGMATGMGASAGGMAAGAAGMFGSFMVPIGIGAGVMHAVERGVFQPYIRSRQMAEIVQDNFAGITFSGGGNPISGRGLGGRQSATLGSGIDSLGMRDMTFGANQIGGIASMGMRAGLFDQANSTGDILKQVGSIAAQIKTIVAISKDPNIQSAIEELAKLRLGGASITGGSSSVAMGAYGAIGMYASAAGASVQRIMNTVGQQGQYMFQMNGLTPYLGQVAAANAYSGFAAAQRSGLMSTAQLARMGGLEGATQSSLAGQVGSSSTMYNMMSLFNQYQGRGRSNNVVGNVSTFGNMASQNPLGMIGSMTLHGDLLRSNQSQSEGPMAAERQAIEILRAQGRMPGPNGYDPNEVAAIMGNFMTPEQIRSYMSMRASQTDPKTAGQSMRAMRAQAREQILQVTNQEMLWGGPVGRTVAGVTRGVKSALSGAAETLAYPVTHFAGSIADGLTTGWNVMMNGTTVRDYQKESVGGLGLNMEGVKDQLGRNNRVDRNSGRSVAKSSADVFSIISSLDRAARGGGEGSAEARKLLEVGFDSPESQELFAKFLSSQSDPVSRKALESLDENLDIFYKVANAAKRNVIQLSEADQSSNKAAMTIEDQARSLFMEEGSLAVNVEKVRSDPKYAALNESMSGLGSTDRASKVKALALAGAARKGVHLDPNGSNAGIRRALATMSTADKSISDVERQSGSQIDYKSYVDAHKQFAEAVNKFVGATNPDKDSGSGGAIRQGIANAFGHQKGLGK